MSLSPSTAVVAEAKGVDCAMMGTLGSLGRGLACSRWAGASGLAVLTSMALCGLVFAATGTDTYGYTWADAADGGPDFDYQENFLASPLTLVDDDFVEVEIGFPFSFYGETYEEIDIHSNGSLTFGAEAFAPAFHNCSSETVPGPAYIAPYWVDLDPRVGGVYPWLSGDAPFRIFTVEWFQVPHYSAQDPNTTGTVTFEVRLFENDGRIEFHYRDVTVEVGSDKNNGGSSAILIGSGTNSLVVSCDEASVSDEYAIGFTPPACDDNDNDGYCEVVDCDDEDADSYPGATELCDGKDNDCDNELSEDEIDGDGDGFGPCEEDCDDEDSSLSPADIDEDGSSSCDGDCDDQNATLNLRDLDGDGDSSCTGDCDDEDGALNIRDTDNDGQTTCSGDCHDGDPAILFGADELCDGKDNDCDNAVDEDSECGSGSGNSTALDIPYGCILSCRLDAPTRAPGDPWALVLLIAGGLGLRRHRWGGMR